MVKCPYCNNYFDARTAAKGVSPPGTPPPGSPAQMRKLTQWLNEPTPLADLLLEVGCPNLAPFSPLDRIVVRTAFRRMDAAAALGKNFPPGEFKRAVSSLTGWAPSHGRESLFGVQGRWWRREGYADTPGFVDAYELEERERSNMENDLGDLI